MSKEKNDVFSYEVLLKGTRSKEKSYDILSYEVLLEPKQLSVNWFNTLCQRAKIFQKCRPNYINPVYTIDIYSSTVYDKYNIARRSRQTDKC